MSLWVFTFHIICRDDMFKSRSYTQFLLFLINVKYLMGDRGFIHLVETKNTLKAHSLLYFLYSVIHTYLCIRKSIHNNFPHTKIIHSYIFITMFIFFLLYIICWCFMLISHSLIFWLCCKGPCSSFYIKSSLNHTDTQN